MLNDVGVFDSRGFAFRGGTLLDEGRDCRTLDSRGLRTSCRAYGLCAFDTKSFIGRRDLGLVSCRIDNCRVYGGVPFSRQVLRFQADL